MEKVLKLYKYIDGVNDVPFPNEEHQVVTSDFRYDVKRMGGAPMITCTIIHVLCLDKLWNDNVYAYFNGERFFIKQVPTSSYAHTDSRYKHELELVSERIVLDNVYVYDVVDSNASNDKPVSNSSKFSFFGTIHEFAERLNQSLQYSNLEYRVVVDNGISSEAMMVSFQDQFFSNAIQESYNTYNIPYYFVGKTIHFGYTDNVITRTFKYGQDESLLSIQKQNANYKIVNRVTGVGSADNIPYYYPNDYESKAEVEANGGTWINPQTNLMPSIYRESLGSERFYEALNNVYKIPNSSEYYEFANPYIEGKPKEHIVNFEDVKPTIKGIKNASSYRIDMFSAFAYDANDNDEIDEDGNYLHPYFFAKLRKFDGEHGFNLFEHSIDEQEMTIAMTSGSCGACEFVIGVDESTQKNPVQVDDNGYLERDDDGNVKFGTPQDKQNDTINNEVWIALRKDIDTFGVIMPNATSNYKPSVNDTFVILHIDLPKAYIIAAEDNLKAQLIEYMSLNNSEKFNFSISFSRIFFAEHPDILAQLNENARIQIEYDNTNYELYISSYSYSMSSDKPLPEIRVELSDTLTISQNALQTAINDVKNEIISNVGGISNVDFLKQGLRYFLRKDKDDETKGSLGVQKDLNVGGNTKIGGNTEIKGKADIQGNVTTKGDVVIGSNGYAEGFTGFGTKFSRDGSGEMSRLTLRHELRVPKLIFNSIEINVGDKWRGAGGGVIERVEPDYNTDGSMKDTGTIWLQLEEGQIGAVYDNAISQGIFHDFTNKSNNETTDSEIYEGDKMIARTFAGFTTVYFLITEISDYTDENGIVWRNKQCRYQLRPTSTNWTSKAHPYAQMNFVCYGVMSDDEELLEKYGTSAYETRTYTRLLWRQNTWEIGANNIASQSGDLSNLDILGLDAKGYSNYLNSVYFTGEIRQVNPNTGEPIKTANDRGEWVNGTTYYYYDRVSHEGGLWLCVAEDGTNTEPKEGDAAWLLQVKPGTSVTTAGHWESSKVPYKVNSIVTFADKVWISNKDTSEPPFGIYTDKDINRLIYKDNGYVLVDTLIQSDDWDLLLDAPQLTDGKDGASVQVRYSSDKTNWHDTFKEGDIWMQQRVGDDSLWSDAIRIVGEAGAAGLNGTYYDYQFAVNDSLTIAPATGWQDTPPSVGIGQYLWMRTRFVDPNSSEVNPWSVVRIGGEKGRGVETVVEYYQVSESNTVAPTTWVKEMPTLTPTLKYLWNYEDVVYTDTEKVSTTPIVIGMYSKDGNGIKSVTEYYGLTDDADTQPTSWDTEILKPTQELRFLWNKVVTLYTEGEETTVIRIIAVHGEKGDGLTTLGAWKTGMAVPYLGIVTMGGKTFVAKVATSNPPIWVYTDNAGNRLIYKDKGYILEGTENTEEYDLLIQNGKDGSDGKDYEYIYIHTTSNNRPATPNSLQTDDYIPSGWHDDPVGVSETIPYEWVCVRVKREGIWGNYSIPALWAKFGKDGIDGIQGIQGEKGEQGVPGEKGADGLTSYFHIKFADDANGTNMNESGGDYIGTYVDFTQADSTDPKKYTWVKTRGVQGEKGDQGIPGTNGINGETSYLHIAYANSSDGKTDFSVSESKDKLYIGQYTDFVLEDSTDPTKYKWTLIKGADGKDGVSIKSVTVTYGKSKSLSSMPTSWDIAMPNVGEGEYLWTRTITDYTDDSIKDTVTYTYSYQGKTGMSGTSVSVVSITYQAGTSPTTTPTGEWSEDIVDVPQGQYLWTKTVFSDGTVAYGVAKQGTDGKDGEGFTLEGNWYTGLAVPKNGVVTMGGGCFVAKVATTNPPMWCWTDKSGNRLIFSATEYILTGELNTSEYEQWSVRGEDGKDGQDGQDGKDGENGKDGVATFKSTVFIRQTSQPSTPSGGSFSSPVPSGWSDGIPSGELTLWASTRIFTEDGSSPQQSAWTTPRKMTDTSSFEVIYHSSETEPVPPTNYPSTSGDWTPDNGWTDNPSTDSVWMATATKSNGVWGKWIVTKVKGETGKEGKQGAIGYTGCVTRVFQEYSNTQVYRNDTNATPEELDVSGIRYLDMLVLATEDLVNYPSGYVAFECLKTHSGHATTESEYWREFSSNIASQFVPKLIALDAHLRFASSGQVVILDENQNPCAGMAGSQKGDKTRIWAGSDNPDKAPFAVNQSGETTASKFRTARNGLRMEAANGLISIFGSLAKNIEFGVNEEGLAVMRYYDNDGTLLYDLGPSGISTVKRENDKWVLKRLTYLGADADDLFGTYWATAKNPFYVTGEDKYQFLSGYIGGALNDAANNRKLFNSQSKTNLNGTSNVISDGWYCDTLPANATELSRLQYGYDGVLPDDMNENNPLFNTDAPIYVTEAFYVLDGLVFNRMNVYYNLVES